MESLFIPPPYCMYSQGLPRTRQIIKPKETLTISKYRIFVDAEKAFVDVLQILNCFGQALEKFVPKYFDRIESNKPERPPIKLE